MILGNRDRVIKTFVRLAEIPSPKLQVRKIMRHLAQLFIQEFGLAPFVDEAGKDMPGFECGNMFVDIPATSGCEHLPCLGVEAHVDTVAVPADASINVVVEDDVIRTDVTTILGADDKSGLTAIVEALRLMKELRLPHGPIQVYITVGEENSMYGLREMDFGLVKAQSVVCVDGLEGNTAWRSCAAKLKYKIKFVGKAGHGALPESTLNAILMAAAAISSARCRDLFGPGDIGQPYVFGVILADKQEDQVWHNISEIFSHQEGASNFPSTNVVPGEVIVSGEFRAFRPDLLEATFAELVQCFEAAVANFTAADGLAQGRVEVVEVERPYPPFCLPVENPLVQKTLSAMRAASIENPKADITPGATHANVFNQHGVPTVVLGAGGRNPHATNEYVIIDEMVKAAEVLVHFLAA